MSYLDQISKPKDRPIIATLTGDAGIGKTSLAATFPKPIFVRVEDGLQSIPYDSRPDAFPVIQSIDDLWGQLTDLVREDHAYKTIVIDSVTELDQLFVKHVVDSDPKKPKSINQAMGGYGAGLQAVGHMHQKLRNAARKLNENRDMHVIFIAHPETNIVELPDQDPYTRYDLRLNKRSVSPYVDNVDLVGYLKLETFLKGDDDDKRKQALTTGNRILVTYTSASNISKNRYGITKDIRVTIGENPLIEYIPALREEI